MRFRLLIVVLFFGALFAVASTVLEEQFVLESREELGAVLCAWGDAGIDLTLGCAGGTNKLKVTRAGTFSEGSFKAQLLRQAPSVSTNNVWLVLKRRPQAWTLYLADEPVARFAEAATGAVAVAVSNVSLPPEENQDSYTQRLGEFRFEDGFMVPEGDKLSDNWEQVRGEWSLHTVIDEKEALTIQVKKGGRIPTPARSPNYYSLHGAGANALILAGEYFHDSYAVRAAIQHNEGTNGVVFLATEAGAFYALTARTDSESDNLVVELWRSDFKTPTERHILAAFQTDLTPGQWLQLEAVVFDDRIVILADGIELGRFALAGLPFGGRYGLYSDSAVGTRFDDFAVGSHQDYPFDCGDDATRQTKSVKGAFNVRSFGEGTDLPQPATLQFGAGASEWRFGSDTDEPHRLAMRFLLPRDGSTATVGLLAGGSGGGAGWRFACRADSSSRHYTLTRLDGTNTVVVESATLPAAGRDIRLALDALRVNELRAYADDLQVLFHRTELPLGGGGAVEVRASTPLSAAMPEYTTRAAVYADRFEKNLQYVNDPFMRHWASPEGQWHIAKDNQIWLRGDMIRRIRLRMPVTTEASRIFLATGEGGSNAACRVECRDGVLHGYTIESGDEPCFTVAVTNIPIQEFPQGVKHRLYTLGLEDHVFWLGDDTRLLATAHLSQPAEGRRVRIDGFDLTQLRFSLARRENVFDSLFNESLQNWSIGGGRWEVVNRFQCDPTWSHLNGENAESLAALWSKYEFSGDFCAELYAGTRHGKWYNRVGDLNMTVLSPRGTTGEGYSITVTGWDPDNSQNETRLFRNGQVVATTDAYLLPRFREGNVRRGGYEPLVPGGRDVHGAWYGIRLRRTADRVQLVYDNLPALEYTDPNPLEGGCFGIWTYRNSMMVARVRIVAETVRPRRFVFKAISTRQSATASLSDNRAFVLPPHSANGLPLNTLVPSLWEAADPVSRPLTRFSGIGDKAEMTVSAHHGGGTFFVTNRMPSVAASKMLGWRFEMARSADASVNFEFSVGQNGDKGFAAESNWSYVISGSADQRGPRRVAGSVEVPPTPEGAKPLWSTAYIWLPCEVLTSGKAVLFEGFGNLQPSDIQQGLSGNGPGAWYKIRQFRPVFRGYPSLGGIASQEALDAAAAAISARPPGELTTYTLPQEAVPQGVSVEWAVPPDVAFGLQLQRDPERPDTLVLCGTNEWNSPLLPPQAVSVDGTLVNFVSGNRQTDILLPRLLESSNSTVEIKLADGRTFKQTIPAPAPPGSAPLLLTLEMPEGGLTTFEQRPLDGQAFNLGAGVRLIYGGPEQGTLLEVCNNGKASRMAARLAQGYDPLLTPLVQLTYRAEPMARFSIITGRSHLRFTENAGTAATISGAIEADNTWQTWLGSPLKAIGAAGIKEGFAFPAADLQVISRHGHDQSGLYSSFHISQMALGPAVGPSRILAFRALYDDIDGDLTKVEYALIQGREPWVLRTPTEQTQAVWQTIANGEVTTPDISKLSEGLCHLIVRAHDAAGNISTVSDVPFLLDRTPPVVKYAVVETTKYNKTALNLTIDGGYAMPSLRGLGLTCNGKQLNLVDDTTGVASFSEAGINLEINWPWLLRRQLQQAKHGDILKLSFEGVADIAGNSLERIDVPITLDIANDKTPPTVELTGRPKNINSWLPQISNLSAFFQRIQLDSISTLVTEDGSVVTAFNALDNGSSCLVNNFRNDPGWKVSQSGWLGLSIRTMSADKAAAPNVELRLLPRALPNEATKPDKGKHYVISLKNSDSPYVHGKLNWYAGEWQNIMIDVAGFLCNATGLKEAPDIRDVIVAFADKETRSYQIRAAAIMAPYGEKDIVRFRAYDISGVEGLKWSGGSSTKLSLRPSLVPRDAGSVWLDVRVADRSGNLSQLYMIPVPPVAMEGNVSGELPEDE